MAGFTAVKAVSGPAAILKLIDTFIIRPFRDGTEYSIPLTLLGTAQPRVGLTSGLNISAEATEVTEKPIQYRSHASVLRMLSGDY